MRDLERERDLELRPLPLSEPDLESDLGLAGESLFTGEMSTLIERESISALLKFRPFTPLSQKPSIGQET